jgi:hypothetical protein
MPGRANSEKRAGYGTKQEVVKYIPNLQRENPWQLLGGKLVKKKLF